MARKQAPGMVTVNDVRELLAKCGVEATTQQVMVAIRILNDRSAGIVDEVEVSIQTARSAGVLEDTDRGAVEGLRLLAQVLRDRDPYSKDNVTYPMFFKACEQLGLTPSGRASLAARGKGKPSDDKPATEEVTLEGLQQQANLRVVRD